MRYRYVVHGMHCDVCIEKVESALTGAAGVVSFLLDAPRRSVVIEIKGLEMDEVDFDRLQKRLRAAGGYSLSDGVVTFSTAEKIRWSIPPAIAILTALTFAILRGVAIGGWSGLTFSEVTLNTLGAMFIIFGVSKVASWKGFIANFVKIDSLARRIRRYAQLYPLIEIGLGIAYIVSWQSSRVHWAAFAVVLFTTVGMIGPVRRRENIGSPSLGTLFPAPLTSLVWAQYVSLTVIIFSLAMGWW